VRNIFGIANEKSAMRTAEKILRNEKLSTAFCSMVGKEAGKGNLTVFRKLKTENNDEDHLVIHGD
jgi:hypothetical protein